MTPQPQPVTREQFAAMMHVDIATVDRWRLTGCLRRRWFRPSGKKRGRVLIVPPEMPIAALSK